MRFLRLPITVLTLAMFLVPRPAHAWFAFLDYLSGPGRFYGEKFDFRVKCFGDNSGIKDLELNLVSGALSALSASKNLVVAQQNVAASNENKESALAQLQTMFAAAKNYLSSMANQLAVTNAAIHLADHGEIAALQQKIDGLDIASFTQFADAFTVVEQVPASAARLKLVNNAVYAVLQELEVQVDHTKKHVVSIASTGIFVSFCSPDVVRKYSIELGATLQQMNSDPDYAQTYPIHLNTLTAAVSYRLAAAVDLRAAAGGYQFSSRGFDTFYGWTIEPAVDFHGPATWVNDCGFKLLASLLTARVGLVWFPGGFDTVRQFAASPSKARQISGLEATPSLTIYYNLAPYLRRRTRIF